VQQTKGFTLIELLIVVAIIAILAAIAVPNFLEAQTRAKVTRVQSDMRTLATGVESYRVDYNRIFTTTRVDNVVTTRKWIWGYMTTPVAYMTSVPNDPFNLSENPVEQRSITIWGPDYLDGNGKTYGHRDGVISVVSVPAQQARSATFFSPYPDYVQNNRMTRNNFWVMISWGPDQVFEAFRGGVPSPVIPYDPSNGTISDGDLVRFQQ